MNSNLAQENLAMQEILALAQDLIVFSLHIMETIRTRIARLRIAAKLSMVELGDKIGVSWQTIQQWENGKTAPQRRRMPKVAESLGVTLAYLLSADDHAITPYSTAGTPPNEPGRTLQTPESVFARKYLDESKEIAEVVKLMENMDDTGRGMVLQATRSIARERAQLPPKGNAA